MVNHIPLNYNAGVILYAFSTHDNTSGVIYDRKVLIKMATALFQNGPFLASFSLFSSFCRGLDSNYWPLVLEATALSVAPGHCTLTAVIRSLISDLQ